MPRKYSNLSRFRKRESARSGFDGKEIEMVKDLGVLVKGDEFDMPPPSNLSLGGEGDISPGFTRSDYTNTATPAENQKPTYYITAGGGIAFTPSGAQFPNQPGQRNWLWITGSNGTVTITASPRITAGITDGTVCTLECVGSSIILSTGGGLRMTKPFTMLSGSVISYTWVKTDSTYVDGSYPSGCSGYVWQEASRTL